MTSVVCAKCFGGGSGPKNFLLKCQSCSRGWHHRCHRPPVAESELLRRIRATNEDNSEKGLAGWKCGRCSTAPPKPPTAASSTADRREYIVVEDDEETEFPPRQRPPLPKKISAKSASAGKQVTTVTLQQRNPPMPLTARVEIKAMIDLTLSSDKFRSEKAGGDAEKALREDRRIMTVAPGSSLLLDADVPEKGGEDIMQVDSEPHRPATNLGERQSRWKTYNLAPSWIYGRYQNDVWARWTAQRDRKAGTERRPRKMEVAQEGREDVLEYFSGDSLKST